MSIRLRLAKAIWWIGVIPGLFSIVITVCFHASVWHALAGVSMWTLPAWTLSYIIGGSFWTPPDAR